MTATTSCSYCGSSDPNLVGVEVATGKECREPFHCPTPDGHGNPFRYCPNCNWIEPRTATPSDKQVDTSPIGKHLYRVTICMRSHLDADALTAQMSRAAWPYHADDSGLGIDVVALSPLEEVSDPRRHPFDTNGFPFETCLKCGYTRGDHLE